MRIEGKAKAKQTITQNWKKKEKKKKRKKTKNKSIAHYVTFPNSSTLHVLSQIANRDTPNLSFDSSLVL